MNMKRVGLTLALLIAICGSAQAQLATGVIDANGESVAIRMSNVPSAVIEVTGTFTGTLTFQESPYETCASATTITLLSSTWAPVTTATAAGKFIVNNPGWRFVCVTSTAWTSGTAIVTANTGYVTVAPPASVSIEGASNPAASATGAAVPASAGYTGINVGGNLRGWNGFSLGGSFFGGTAIVDASGNQITSFGGGTQYQTAAAQATPTGTLALGYDGANLRHLLTNASGHLNVIFPSAQNVANAGTFAVQAAQSGTWNVTNISGTVSLPTGAATAANQATANTALVAIETATEATQAAVEAANAQDVAHDAADTGNPVKIGYKAIALGANPTGVTANDRTNSYATRAGQLFTIGGHPNVITVECHVADADGAQTGTACVTVSAGTKIVVTQVQATCSAANSGNVNVRVALDTDSTLAAEATTGAAGILLRHAGISAGSGVGRGDGSGIIAIGADDADLRYTMADPVGGSCAIVASYFTIEG